MKETKKITYKVELKNILTGGTQAMCGKKLEAR